MVTAAWTTPLGKWFPRAEMMAKALEIWPMHVIEEALGDDADARPAPGNPERGAARPFAAASHRHAGVSGRTAGDHRQRRVERELDGIASAHIEELSASQPAFAEAMTWPAG